MSVLETCVINTFTPDAISEVCRRCSGSFLKHHDLDLRQCLFKCNGARESNQCTKCKEILTPKWDSMCLPKAGEPGMDAAQSSNAFSLRLISHTYYYLLFLSVVSAYV